MTEEERRLDLRRRQLAARLRAAQPQQERTWGQYLRENIVGDGAMDTPGEKLGGLLNLAGESMTFGLVGDEAAAAADAAIGRGAYGDRLGFYRDQQSQLEAENPVASLTAQVAPALIPGAGIMAGVSRVPTLLGRAGASAAASGVLGGAYGFMEGEGGLPDRLDSARDVATVSGVIGAGIPVVGAGVQAGARRIAERRAAGQVAASAPATQSLIDDAAALYERARQNGITANPQQTQALADRARQVATQEGLITPAGRVAESYPRLRDVLNMLDDFGGGTMDPAQMQAVRRTLQAAAQSADGNERRIGTAMLRQFDDWVEPLAPEFRQANAIYRRAMNSQMIDEAIELAGLRAGQFTGSGYENALRTEFRALARKIVKGDIRGLTKTQIDAINRVAEGGTIENALRDLGKAAPRGIVSTGIATSVPFMIGNALGGPGLGVGAAGLTLGAGEIGRRTATAMQTRNANVARGLMATGGQLPLLPNAGAQPAGLLQALMLGGLPSQVSSYTQAAQ